MKTALFALALMAAPLTVASVAHADACDDRAAVDASHACKSPVCGAD